MPVYGSNFTQPQSRRYGRYTDYEIDEARSFFPTQIASGWYNYADSQAYTAVISALSASTVFIAKQLIIANREARNRLVFYDHGGAGAGVSMTAFEIYIANSQTDVIDIANFPFHSGVFVSNLDSQCSVRILGILVVSTW